MPKQRAADFRVTIGGVAYAVQRIYVSQDVGEILVSNTEGQPGNSAYVVTVPTIYTAIIPDLGTGTIRLSSATFDSSFNPFAAPYSIFIGAYYSLRVWPAGAAGVSYRMANMMCKNIIHEGTIPGPQPVTMEFHSDGEFLTAYV